MKTKLFLFALITSFSFSSCEKDESTEPEKNKIYLVSQYQYLNNQIGNETKNFTYNENNKVEKITNTYEGKTTIYDLEYDSMDRVIKIYKNDEAQYEFEYSTGTIIEKWNYNMTGYWEKTTYNVNNAGKITRRQTEGSDSYSTYTWVNENMSSENYYSSYGNTTTTYKYDANVLNPSYNQYLLQHPMWESKNGSIVSDFGTDNISYTLSANEAGYLTKKIFTSEYFGTITQSYTYITVTED